jgi:hypothetical protein
MAGTSAQGTRVNPRRQPITVLRLAARSIAITATATAVLLMTIASGRAAAAARPDAATVPPPGLASVVAEATSVPARVLKTVGAGHGVRAPLRVTGSPLVSHGKPELLYFGADYCPYCGFQQWALIVALSRFGTFTGLNEVRSSPTDVYPGTATLRFYGATYRSKYLTFVTVDMYSRAPNPVTGGYPPLQTPTRAEWAVWKKYNGMYSFPFLDIRNAYVQIGSMANPGVLHGKTWAQIAQALHDPSTVVARAVDSSANDLIAAICKVTGNRPASACADAVKL